MATKPIESSSCSSQSHFPLALKHIGNSKHYYVTNNLFKQNALYPALIINVILFINAVAQKYTAR